MKKSLASLLACWLVAAVFPPVEASYTYKKGKFIHSSEMATLGVQDHFAAGAAAYEAENWAEAAKHFCIVTLNFPTSPYGQEAHYFLGVSYFFLEEYDFANCAFTEYLKVQSNPRYFQSAVEFKFCIAEHFNAGAKKRAFGTKQMPKWFTAQSLALEIYDEVIAAVPCHELAARSLMAKGCLLWRWHDYRNSVEAFQMVIRRFPKYEGTPECYLYVGKIFLEQSRWEFQNSDILSLAQINLRKFERDFPREERLGEAAADVMAIKEVYAEGLYDTGRFFERTCKPRAAMIYYNDAIRQFPDTCVAERARQRMAHLDPGYCFELPDVITDDGEGEVLDAPEDDMGLVDFGSVE